VYAVMPDFAQVYSFIGNVFDPNSTNHLQKLRQMDPINVETVINNFLFLFIVGGCKGLEFWVHGRSLCA